MPIAKKFILVWLSLKLFIYADDSKQASANNEAQDISKLTQTVLTSTPENRSTYSQPVTFIAYVVPTNVPGKIASGKVQFQIDKNVMAIKPLVNGVAKYTVQTPLPTTLLKEHDIGAIFLGNEKYDASKDFIKFGVIPSNTTTSLNVWPNPLEFGKPLNLSISLQAQAPAIAVPDGEVLLYVDTVNVATLPLDKSGRATYRLDTIEVGKHAISAIYQRNLNFTESKADAYIEVEKAASSIDLKSNDEHAVYGQAVSFAVKASSAAGIPSGNVQLLIEGTPGAPLANLDERGEATFVIKNWSAGQHPVEVEYYGNGHFKGSNATLKQDIQPAATELAVSSTKNPARYGDAVGIDVGVSSSHVQPVGYIQFQIDGKNVGTPFLLPKNGRFTLNNNQLKPGEHEIVVEYLGNENFLASNKRMVQEVNKVRTDILMSSENPLVYGNPVKLLMAVSAENRLIPTGIIQIKIDGKNVGEPQDISLSGQSILTLPSLNVGTYKIEAEYFGNENFSSSTASFSQVVTKAPAETTLFAKNKIEYQDPLKLDVIVKGKSRIPEGDVQFFVNGEPYSEPLHLLKGQTSLQIPHLNSGEYHIKAVYQGDNNFNSSDANQDVRVNKAEIKVFLETSSRFTLIGDPITFTAKVIGKGVIEGSIQLTMDDEPLAKSLTLDEEGGATMTLPKGIAAEGTHQIKAIYSGDNNHQANSSWPLVVSVNKKPQ